MKDLKFSLIICTLGVKINEFNRLIKSLETQTYKNIELIIISQGNHDKVAEVLADTFLSFKHYNSDRKGLSYNRNLGLKLVTGDIVSISDDDCWYPPDGLYNVFNAYRENPSFTVFAFQIYDPAQNLLYKDYNKNSKEYGIYDVGKCSSIEIFFSATSKNINLKFDERFGLGATYPSGEENIFLADLLKVGNQILYVPKVIVYHNVKTDAYRKFNLLKMKTSFYMFKRIFKFPKYIFIYLLFYFKHYKSIEDKLSSFFIFSKN